MKIVADENIPFARDAFGTLGTVLSCPGSAIDRSLLRGADVLLVRSVTQVNHALLADSSVRFVGSATIGRDHVDESYLRDRGIAFSYAPGSNAESVVEYVLSALLQLAVRRGVSLRGRTVGIVGCGNIGSRLSRRLAALGLDVIRNDPPLAAEAESCAAGANQSFVPLSTVLAEADIVTLHVPLTRRGPYPTFHLFDRHVLNAAKKGVWLINTSRGPVIDNAELKKALRPGRLAAVLDVWEGEPEPDRDLIARVELGTPHVAGYSFDGKVQGTLMLYEALVAFLDRPKAWDVAGAFAPAEGDRLRLTPPDPALPETDWLHSLIVRMYDISGDHARMMRYIDLPADERGTYFTSLRKTYPRRRAFERHCIKSHLVPEAYLHAVREGLGVQIVGSGQEEI